MTNHKGDIPDYLLEEMQNEMPSFRLPNISNRDHALFLIEERDLEAQLVAIKGALRRNQSAEKTASQDIKDLEDHIRSYAGGDVAYQMHIEDQWVDAVHGTVFQDAAHSMAAVGMLAPFVESLFVAIFAGLRNRQAPESTNDQRAKAAQDQYWNAQVVFRKEGPAVDIVRGIEQLAESTGLRPYLPGDYSKVVTALFAYRNNMFHNGFEWPVAIRERFNARINAENWGSWFTKSESGDTPWIFYMSEAFIQLCLTMIDDILDGVGQYLSRSKGREN